MQAKAKLASSITFIVLASFTIVTYDRQNMFIIQATDVVYEKQKQQINMSLTQTQLSFRFIILLLNFCLFSVYETECLHKGD